MFFEVGVARKQLETPFYYQSIFKIDPGQIVTINFRNSSVLGIILSHTDENPPVPGTIKDIVDISQYSISSEYIQFITKFAQHNLIPLGSALKLLIPFTPAAMTKFGRKLKGILPKTISKSILTTEQLAATQQIAQHLNEFAPFLLHGVTGSGKTEVYLDITQKTFDKNGQILILVPEISLSNRVAQAVADRLNTEVYIWHNTIATNSKLSIWRKAICGDPMVVIGARSALFIPFKNLKLIIVDEEHDSSFKQNDHQIYHGRDMAVLLASIMKIPIILSSATPSLESFYNAKTGKYIHLQLHDRYGGALPKLVPHVMLSGVKKSIFSDETIEEINKYLKEKQQVLIFINRRGYTPKRLCPTCGWKAQCDACDSWLCFHKSKNKLCCHYCGIEKENIQICPECNNQYLTDFGLGIEKVYAECLALFPQARVMQCSSDNMNTPNKIEKILKQIEEHEVDIVIGTQVLAKGHNFPDLNLVVITNLDEMLYNEDFRSFEHTWQLISQVAGRAGRFGQNSGKVIIQTFSFDEPFLKLLLANDQNGFYEQELKNRKTTQMPPFGFLTSIELLSSSDELSMNTAKDILRQIPRIPDLIILGPIRPIISKLKYKYRIRIIFISSFHPQKYIKKYIKPLKLSSSIQMKIDMNPVEFF